MHRLRSVQLLLDLTLPGIMTIDVEKKKRRKLKRRWRKSTLSTDRQLYITQCALVTDMIRDAKSTYYSFIIAENKGNQKVLFQTIDQLLQRKQEPRFPTSTSSEQLANEIICCLFFMKRYPRCGVVCLIAQNL